MDGVTLKLERKEGDDRVFIFPVLPERLEIAGDAGNEAIDTIKQGEVTVFGNRKLRRFDIVSFFTANEAAPFCRARGTDYRTPEECVRWLLELQEAREPVWFIPEGLGTDAFWVSVESFKWTYAQGHDIEYTLSLKEYRPFGQRAKTLTRAPDVFATGQEQMLEGTGQRREPAGWAIGDRVTVSGMYYASQAGDPAPLSRMADMPARYLARPWSIAQEAEYKELSNTVQPLRAQRAVIIDTQMTGGRITKTPYPFCIADIATQERIGWVAESQMTRI